MRIFSRIAATVRSEWFVRTASNTGSRISSLFRPGLALLLPLLLTLGASAQVATNYTWASSSGGTYTSFPATQAATLSTVTGTTDAYAVLTLPFTFTYNGIGYTQVTASVDGWLAMGSVTTANNVPGQLFTNAVPTDAIGAWWGDGGQNPNSGGKIVPGLSGTEIYTVQYEQLSGSSTGGNSSSNKMSYQISLYGPNSVSPGKIEILYGPRTATPSANRAIGIKSVTGGTVSFINGVSGSTSSTASNNAFPALGTIYTFTPANACATPANAATGFTVGSTTSTTIGISFTAASGSPTGYVAVRTPFGSAATNPVDGTTYTTGAGLGGTIESVGSATSFTSSGLTASTQYTYTVFAYNNTNCLGGPKYLTATSLTGDASTTATPGCATPLNAATGFTIGATSGTSIGISFTAAAGSPSGYLVVRTPNGTAPTNPVDGTTYTTGSGLGGYIESVNSSTSFTSTGLNPATTYTYTIFSYNANCIGAPAYLTSSTLSGNASTTACTPYGSVGFNQFQVGPGGTWTSIGSALAAISSCTNIVGPIVLELQSTYVSSVETYPLSLPSIPGASASNTITIRPETGATGLSISNGGTGTLLLSAGKYYIIDGRAGGAGTAKQLTLSNTAGAYAVQFINDATNNVIKYCTIKSGNTSATSGTIVFSTTTGSTGNGNNTLDNNDIGDASGAMIPHTAIYSLGTTTTSALGNSACIISNNNIFNFFSSGSGSNGINLQGGNTDWTISGNSFYQTATRTSTGGSTHTAINIANSSGSNFTVSGNYIGGNTAQCGGSAWNFAGTNSNRFRAIALSVATSPLSSVQGNTIANFTMVTTNVSASGGGPFAGIYLNGGAANIGGVTGNTIGGSTGNGSISITLFTNSGASPCGILGDPSSTNSIISKNFIGAITVAGNTAANSISFTAISTTSGTSYTISNNQIGSTVTSNSIQAITAATGATAQVVSGISCSGGTPTLTISNNTIANLSNAYAPATAATVTLTRGIFVAAGKPTISSNVVRNLSASGATTSTGANATVIGIGNSSVSTGAWGITQNTVSSLSATNATAASTVVGIYNAGPTTFGTVGRNSVFNLSASSDLASATGIEAGGGTASYQNNMVRLGTGNSLGQSIMGIAEMGGTANFFYHNTVYVGGTAATGSQNSYAFSSSMTTGTRDIRNNIFVTTRSNPSAHHYAIRVGGTAPSPAGLTLNYNVYASQVAELGLFNGITRSTLSDWQAAVGQDANSLSGFPCFADATNGTAPDLHLTNCSGIGNIADGVGSASLSGTVTLTDDYDGQVRATASLSPVDIGADAGNFGQLNDLRIDGMTQPTATSCHSATEEVIVTLTNNHSNTLTFASTPVTITTTVTGAVNATITRTLGAGFQPATLAPGASLSVVVGQLNTTANGNYTINTSISVFNDVNSTNDASSTVVTINHSPLAVSASAAIPSFCGPGSTTISSTPSGGTLPYSYSWNTGATTQNISTGTVNSTTTYTVTVTDNCGVMATDAATVTILPALTADIDAANSLLCTTGSSTNILVTNGPANGSVTYTTNGSNPQTLQLNGSGAGSFATGPLNSNATYAITLVSNNSCSTASTAFTTVYVGTIVADPIPNQNGCAGSTVGPLTFSGNLPNGTQYTWSAPNGGAIGMAQTSGTGTQLPAFTATNNGGTALFADVTVMPVVTADGCKVRPMVFRITANPIPTVNAISNQQVCAATSTAAVNFSGNTAGADYVWTNNNTAIGLASTGAGNIPSFMAQNNSAFANISGTITVTPVAVGCSGTPVTFTITVTRSVVSIAYSGSPYCQGGTVNPVLVGTRGGTYSSTVGLTINPATGQINLGQSQPGTYTVTYTAPASGGACGGAVTTQITIKPQATVNTIGNQLYCPGMVTAPVAFTGTATSYAWSNDNTSIGLAASGTGTQLPSFTTVNGGPLANDAYIAVMPLGNGTSTCNGRAIKFRFRVAFCPPVTQSGGTGANDQNVRTSFAANFEVGPNPARSTVVIRYSGREQGLFSVQLVSQYGQPVGRVFTFSGTTYSLDLSNITPGAYSLKITNLKSGLTCNKQVIKL